jgi:hypothetical protein
MFTVHRYIRAPIQEKISDKIRTSSGLSYSEILHLANSKKLKPRFPSGFSTRNLDSEYLRLQDQGHSAAAVF